jgi:phage gp36-like protein
VAYCLVADVEFAAGGPDRLLQLADWSRLGAADQAVIATAIRAAGGEIDAGACKLFAVPLGDVAAPLVVNQPTQVVRDKCAELALCLLLEKRGKLTSELVRRLEAVRTWIIDLAAGRTTPGTTPAPAHSPTMVPDQSTSSLPDEMALAKDKLGGALW